MIARLCGTLADKSPPFVLLDVKGVGYELEVPMSTLYDLPALGEPVTLLVHPIVREDAHLLFGFLRASERSAFRALLKVNGVGPKLALAILSSLGLDDLLAAVQSQSAAALTAVPGVGKKTAERLVLELRDRLDAGALGIAALAGSAAATAGPGASGAASSIEALSALMALGYHERDARAATKDLDPSLSTEAAIRAALRSLARTN